MLKKIMLAALTVSALAVNAPAAIAHDPVYDCGYNSVQQQDATGQNFEGVAYGYVSHDTSEVSISCSIEVNGTTVASTPTGTGTGFAATSGRVSYAAAETDHVALCATVWVFGHEVFKICFESTRIQIPPQVIIDLLIAVLDAVDALVIEHVDPPLCAQLVANAGTYGPIVITPEGDVYIDGDFWWNCPPY